MHIAGLLPLIILYIHSYSFFIHVFAAPLLVTPGKSISNYGFTNAFHVDEHLSYPKVPSVHRSVQSHYTLNSKESRQQVYLLRKRSIWDKIKSGFQKAGQAIKSGFQKVGNAIKSGFQKAGSAIKHGFQKAGNAIKHVANKVWNGVKNVAHKIANGVKTAANKVANGVKHVANKVWNGVKHVANKIASGVKTAANKVANGVKNVANKVWNGVKDAAHKVANGVKYAAQKVASGVKTAVHWVKQNGAKIAKFGLKVLSTAASIGSKIVKFIPGVGKPLSTALNYVSKFEDMGSNAIHADLGPQLNKAVSVMDKIQHPVSGVAGKVLDNLKRDVRRNVLAGTL